MSAAFRFWRSVPLMCAMGVVAGFTAAWNLAEAIDKPRDSDFMSTTTSAYLKYASERGEQRHISYDDCSLVDDVDPSDQGRLGIVRHGVCRYTIDGKAHTFSVALNRGANVEYFEQ